MRNSLLTDDNLNVITKDGIDPDVWAVGDAAIIKTAVLPATAQGRYPCPQSPAHGLRVMTFTDCHMTSCQSEGQIRGEEAEQDYQRPRAYKAI